MSSADHDDQALLSAAYALARNYRFNYADCVDVEEQALIDAPSAYHGQTIRVEATWDHGFEASFIAGAWASPTGIASNRDRGTYRVRAEGLWVFPRPRPKGPSRLLPGFGHLGMSWGEFRMYRVFDLDQGG